MAGSRVGEVELPIDIQYRKLLDWLVDRKRVPREWHRDVRELRLKIESGLAELVEGTGPTVPDFLAGRYLDYYSARRLLQLVLENKPQIAGKDLIGRFTHPSVRAWSDIIKGFENNNLYLAESAQLLINNTDVEAVVLKKNISRLRDTLADLNRREGEITRSAAEARRKYVDSYTLYGVTEGDQSGQTLESLLKVYAAKEAPKLLIQVAHAACADEVSKAIEYYDKFLSQVAKLVHPRCPALKALRGLEPNEVAPTWSGQAQQVTEGMEAAVAVLEWDDSTGDCALEPEQADLHGATEGVVWDIEVAEESSTAPQINWDDACNVDDEDGIDPVVDPADEGLGGYADVQESELDGPIELDSESFRTAFLEDVYELLAFLKQRQRELRYRKPILVLLQAQALPPDLHREPQAITEMLGGVEKITEILLSTTGRRVLDLKSSERQLQRLARELSQEKFAAEKLTVSIGEMHRKRERSREELEASTSRLKSISAHTRELKLAMEASLSLVYEGRKVNILGEVNLL